MSTTANPEAWTRFETLLIAMHPGDGITVDKAAAQTGIVMESAAIVLDALVSADLFKRQPARAPARLERVVSAFARRANS
jgi:hypothetical protein